MENQARRLGLPVIGRAKNSLWTKTLSRLSIKLLHPFMPFVTERVWQELISAGLIDKKSAKSKKFLMVEEWPE
jgi:valyl-tRNA synthetase